MKPTAAASLVLSLSLGCSSPQRAPTPPAPAPTPPAAETTAAAADASVAAPVVEAPVVEAPVAELAASDAQALLDTWLRAQNGGDFAAYERLYAPRFTGVRRSGPRVRQFDRAGWMTDRRAMFGSAMRVAASDVVITSGPGTATVRFTQAFTQGSYRDSGPKEVVLVRAGDSLAIAREEMLASTLGVVAPPPGELMHVVSYGGSRWLLLARAPDDGSWSRGRPALVDRSTQVVVTRTGVSVGAVPAALRALSGQAVRAYAAGGAACEARAGELAVLGRVDVHFGTEQRWSGQDVDGTRVPRASDAAVAREAWAESEGGMVLAARLDDAAGCTDPVWARLASSSAAPAFAPSAADAALTARALASFRALPAWRRLQTDYRAGDGSTGGNWDSHGQRNAPTVTVWQAAGGARRFVTVRAWTAVGGCAEFSGEITAVFEVAGTQGLTLLSDGADPGAFSPTAAVDVDGDGVPEFVTADGLVRKTGAVFRGATPYAVPSHDCGC